MTNFAQALARVNWWAWWALETVIILLFAILVVPWLALAAIAGGMGR